MYGDFIVRSGALLESFYGEYFGGKWLLQSLSEKLAGAEMKGVCAPRLCLLTLETEKRRGYWR
jgi:hypothetical protein